MLAWLVLAGGAFAGAGDARADDWSVTRSEFDPRLLDQLKAQVYAHPEDGASFRRLVGLYKKHSSLEKLAALFQQHAESTQRPWDYYLCGQLAKERGLLDEAAQHLEKAQALSETKKPGPDEVTLAVALTELALKRSPPDGSAARGYLERALGKLAATDGRRKTLLRKQIELGSTLPDEALVEKALTALLALGPSGSDAAGLHRELGESLARSGRFPEALGEWRKVEAAAGGAVPKAQAQLRIGELSESAQDEPGAIAAYRKGLSLLPTGHFLRRDLYERLIAVHRKRDELPQLLKQLETEWPAARRSFSEWELLGRLYDERGDTAGATAAYRAALRKDAHNIDVRRRLIALLERSGVTSEVLAEYEQLINQAPGDSRAYLELAERLHKSGQRQRALATLKRAAGRFGGDPSLHSALAEIYQRWGESDLALAEAELLVRLDPREESYVVNLGELYWARNKKDKADEVWRRLLTANPNRALGQARLADVYAEHNLMPQALELYQKAVKAEPDNLQLRRGLALATERLGRPREALTLWEQLYFAAKAPAERLTRLEARQHLATLVGKEARLLPSYYSWQRRLQAQLSQVSGTQLADGEVLALGLLVADVGLQLGRAGEAESTLQGLRARFPDGPQLAEVLLALVPVYRQQRKLDDAIAALKQAAALLPERRRELYAQLAELSMQSYRDEDAIRFAQQAVTDAQGELRLGELLERKDDPARAIAAYKRAIELDSRMFRAHMALARLHLQRGEFTEAATIYRDVVRRCPQEDMVLEAGRKAIDLHEYLGTLGDLSRELLPLSYAPLPKPVYRRLLLLLVERYATPLVALSRAGDAAAREELVHLGKSGLKPLSETLVDGDLTDQRSAIALLSEMYNPSAAPALLGLVGSAPPAVKEGPREIPGKPAGKAAPRPGLGGAASPPPLAGTLSGPDIDLRVDALLAAARLQDPRSAKVLAALAQSREKQLRLGALYGLARLAGALDRNEAAVLEQGVSDPSPGVKALSCLGVGQLGAARGLSPKVQAQLRELLERKRARPEELDDLPAAACVQALGRAKERAAVPLLIDLLRDGTDEIQRQAAWALGAIGDPRASGPLLRAVYQKREPVRRMAAQALGQIVQLGGEPSASRGAPLPLPLEHRGTDGLDVARLIEDAATPLVRAAGAPAPVWSQEPGPLAAAIGEALQGHRDIVQRTLQDLLAAPDAAPIGLGPLGAQPQLAERVARELLAPLRRLAAAPGAAAANTAAATAARPAGDGEVAVRGLALRVLGRLRGVPAISGEAQAVILQAARTDPSPEVALQAAGLLIEPGAADTGAVLDRLLAHGERWVRLDALQIAARPGGRKLASPAALTKAAADPDGYVREVAARLLAAKSP